MQNVNIHVHEGEIVVMLGSNGAGKSTVFRTISGLNKLSKGEIVFEGNRIDRYSPDRIVQLGIVQCAEGRKLFSRMTVYENLLMGAYIHRKEKEKIKQSLNHVYELFPILKEKRNDLAGDAKRRSATNASHWQGVNVTPEIIAA